MDRDKQLYFAYLTAWAVDRIFTTLCNLSDPERHIDLCTYEGLKNQADVIVDAWEGISEEALD